MIKSSDQNAKLFGKIPKTDDLHNVNNTISTTKKY